MVDKDSLPVSCGTCGAVAWEPDGKSDLRPLYKVDLAIFFLDKPKSIIVWFHVRRDEDDDFASRAAHVLGLN